MGDVLPEEQEPRGLDMSLDEMINQRSTPQQSQQRITIRKDSRQPNSRQNGTHNYRNQHNWSRGRGGRFQQRDQGLNGQMWNFQQHRNQGRGQWGNDNINQHQNPLFEQYNQFNFPVGPLPDVGSFPMAPPFGLPPMQMQQQQQLYQQPDYREHQTCFQEEDTGDVVVKYRRTEVVRVRKNGEVVLKSGGYHGPTTIQSLNDAMNLIGVRVTPVGDVRKGVWNVSDGRKLIRFQEGVVLPANGATSAERGKTILDSYNHPLGKAAVAATAASSAVAAASGINLGGKGAQQGGLKMAAGNGADEAGNLRRLAAKGRYNPY